MPKPLKYPPPAPDGEGPTEGFWCDQLQNWPMPKPDPNTRPQEGSTIPPNPKAPYYKYPWDNIPAVHRDQPMARDPSTTQPRSGPDTPYAPPADAPASKSHMFDYFWNEQNKQQDQGDPEILETKANKGGLTWDDFPLV